MGRNWSLFIANEVNDHPKNMSRIVRISSTTWNMTHLCSVPHGGFYAWTRMARVQKMDDILYFHVFVCPPCPPPQPNKNQLQITEVFKYAKTGTWTCVAQMITWLHKKNTHKCFFPHPTHDFWWSLSVLQLTLGFLLPVKLWAAWQVHWPIWFPFHRFMGFRTSQKGT